MGWRAPDLATSNRAFYFYAALLFLIACILRAHHLSTSLFWHDEVFTQVFSTGHGADDFLRLFDSRIRPASVMAQARAFDPAQGPLQIVSALARHEPQHPPLFYLMANLWSSCWASLSVAPSIAAEGIRIRWLVFLISISSVPVFYQLGRALFHDKWCALSVCAAYCVSPFFVLYAQEAREYALWTLLLAASTTALIRAQERPSWRRYALYAGLLSLSLYTSLSTLSATVAHMLIVIVHNAPRIYLGRRRKGREASIADDWMSVRRFTASLAIAAAVFAPWAWLVAQNYQAMRASMAWSRDIHIPTGELLSTYALNLSRAFVDSGAESWTPVGIAMAVFALFAWLMAVQELSWARFLTLLCLIAAPTGLLLVPDLITGGIRSVSTRYFVPAFIGLLLGMGALAKKEGMADTFSRSRRPILAVLFALAAASSWTTTQVTAWPKGISRALPEVAAALARHPSALVVGDHELHHPGNLLALSTMVDETTTFQLLPSVENYSLPEYEGAVFLFSPNPRFRRELEHAQGVHLERLVEDQHLSLWRVRR